MEVEGLNQIDQSDQSKCKGESRDKPSLSPPSVSEWTRHIVMSARRSWYDCYDGCSWTYGAAKMGDYATLHYFIRGIRRDKVARDSMLNGLARTGRWDACREVLRWVFVNDTDAIGETILNIYFGAKRGGHTDIIQWLWQDIIAMTGVDTHPLQKEFLRRQISALITTYTSLHQRIIQEQNYQTQSHLQTHIGRNVDTFIPIPFA